MVVGFEFWWEVFVLGVQVFVCWFRASGCVALLWVLVWVGVVVARCRLCFLTEFLGLCMCGFGVCAACCLLVGWLCCFVCLRFRFEC